MKRSSRSLRGSGLEATCSLRAVRECTLSLYLPATDFLAAARSCGVGRLSDSSSDEPLPPSTTTAKSRAAYPHDNLAAAHMRACAAGTHRIGGDVLGVLIQRAPAKRALKDLDGVEAEARPHLQARGGGAGGAPVSVGVGARRAVRRAAMQTARGCAAHLPQATPPACSTTSSWQVCLPPRLFLPFLLFLRLCARPQFPPEHPVRTSTSDVDSGLTFFLSKGTTTCAWGSVMVVDPPRACSIATDPQTQGRAQRRHASQAGGQQARRTQAQVNRGEMACGDGSGSRAARPARRTVQGAHHRGVR